MAVLWGKFYWCPLPVSSCLPEFFPSWSKSFSEDYQPVGYFSVFFGHCVQKPINKICSLAKFFSVVSVLHLGPASARDKNRSIFWFHVFQDRKYRQYPQYLKQKPVWLLFCWIFPVTVFSPLKMCISFLPFFKWAWHKWFTQSILLLLGNFEVFSSSANVLLTKIPYWTQV